MKPSKESAATLMTPIAVVGLGALFPGSKNTLAFWRDIMEGQDRLTEVPRSHWLRDDYFAEKPGTQDKVYTTRGGFLPEVDFAPMEFGMPPNALPATDTAQLLALVVAKHALDEATRGKWETVDRSRMSVLLGVASATELVAQMTGRLQKPVWQHAMRQAGLSDEEIARLTTEIDKNYIPWQESTFPGLLGNVVAGRITNRFDMGGSNAVVDAACAGSLAAISMAVNDLALGQSDLVLTGGVDALNDIFMYMCFAQTGALSLSGDCRPFSDKSDGTMLGEGIGMLALRRLADAERDGDAIYAVIRGLGSSSDGRAKSIYAPSAQGQTLALRRAYERAGYGPETVGLVEAHGTSTQAGDAAEFESLMTVFSETSAPKGSIALGSVKAQIGHTKAAAGSAGMIKAILALHHKVLPPTIKVDAPNAKMAISESPFYLNTECRPWVHGAEKPYPRRASVSALGFGGTNFHVALEEYVGPSERPGRMRTAPSELVVLSADTPAALIALCRELAAAAEIEGSLSHLAKRTQLGFVSEKTARLAIVATSETDLREKLAFAAATIGKNESAPFASPKGVHYGVGAPAKSEGVAVLFPGQGSQYVNMGADLAMHFDRVRDVWDGVASTSQELRDASGSLADRVFPSPVFSDDARAEAEKKLTATEWAQPAITATSLGMLRLLDLAGIRPAMVGGHSLGEVTAGVAAGLFDEKTGLGVARMRGELMAQASALPGAMTAVSAERDVVAKAVTGVDVVLANHNSPKQVVLSGSVENIQKAENHLELHGITAKRLPVATAFHSPIVAGSVVPFRAYLEGVAVSPGKIPYYANATADVYPSDPAAIRTQLADAIAKPVRFVEQIEAMYAAGARTFIEVGPDSVLAKLTERCLEGRPHVAVSLDQRGKHGVTAFQTAFGRLAAAGLPLAFARFWDHQTLGEDFATKPKAKFSVKLNGANYGKPYPPKSPVARPPVRATSSVPNAASSASSLPSAGTNGTSNGHTNGHARTVVAPSKSAPPAAMASASAGVPSSMVTAPMRATMATAPIAATSSSSSPHGSFASRPATPAPLSRSTPSALMPAQRPEVSMSSGSPKSPAQASQFVESIQRLQAPAIAAQMEFQRLMAESHMAFLRAVETSYAQIGVLQGAAPQAYVPHQAQLPQAHVQHVPQAFAPPPAPVPVYVQPAPVAHPAPAAPAPAYVQPAPVVHTPAPVYAPVPVAHPSAPAKAPTQAPPQAASQGTSAPASLASLTPTLLAIVADKTGYPAEMIDVNMDMEADLGIDSIKRVEILSAMKAQVPNLPQVATSKMAAMRTLAQIIDLFVSSAPAASGASAPIQGNGTNGTNGVMPSSAPAKAATGGASLAELTPVLLAIVADKTGYPAEMIDVNMDMEADLGIDSIKRVEILSAMKAQVPSLPQVPTSKMAAMRTLAQIIDLFVGSAPAASAASDAPQAQPSKSIAHGAASPAAAPSQAPGSAISAATLTPVLLAIVADKTGYPAEMIDVNMDMEADLGIDSIKRVEILSAMKSQVANLPQVPTSKMAAMRTLAQIIALFETHTPAGAATPSIAPLSRAATAASGALSTATPAPAVNEVPAEPVLRVAVRAVDAPSAGFAMPGILGPGVLAVTPDGTGLQKMLVERLRAHGANAVAMTVAEIPADAAGVIFLGGLREVSGEEAMGVNREAFGAARAVAAHMREHGGLFVTVQDTGGDFGISGNCGARAWLAGTSALAKTAGLEWPKASTKAIDLERGNLQHGDIADLLAKELFAGGPEPEVGIRKDGSRITLASVEVELSSAKRPLPEGAVFVVTGGARGVTAASLVALAKFARPRVLLLGRTPLETEPEPFHGVVDEASMKRIALQEANRAGEVVTPKLIGAKVDKILANREVLATLAALEAEGAKTRYAALDVRDAEALGALLTEVRAAWGPIHGLVHGAGVLADAFIDKKTDAQFDRVFDTKVLGLRALLEATQTDPIQWLCLFSSVAARAGNPGQSDYAMANEILNKVAAVEARRREGRCRVVSIGWGPWDGGMVTPALRGHFESMGVALLGVAAGAQAFVRELSAAPSDDVEVVIGGGGGHDARLLGGQVRSVRVEVLVSAETHPQLESHRIQGKPVLPVVLALEWFARLARALTPGGGPVELRNARVVRGITLDRYDGAGDRFTIATSSTPADPGHVTLELRDENGNLRYAATLAPAGHGPRTKAAAVAVALGASPFAIEEIYSAKNLFHGRDFQVIRRIDGLSKDGADAELTGTADAGWPAEAWQTDAAAVDGGLQLAILCGLGSVGPTLPLRIGKIGFSDRPVTGRIHCALSVSSQTPERVVCDIALSGDDGAPIADLVDVEMYAIPTGNASS